ncbi:hypothetical protein BQ8794_180034 [Mesorhizobium prunaredense]|uniref:Uncharacterized protein n=1 Tax=Mesorhizobium prunaredense TaxID=1631249 RepID=A0A1R3V482_9HYPH|nr:hypothetical protein BQ8794_180034 [Mesorhizobium prunaredense]
MGLRTDTVLLWGWSHRLANKAAVFQRPCVAACLPVVCHVVPSIRGGHVGLGQVCFNDAKVGRVGPIQVFGDSDEGCCDQRQF